MIDPAVDDTSSLQKDRGKLVRDFCFDEFSEEDE